MLVNVLRSVVFEALYSIIEVVTYEMVMPSALVWIFLVASFAAAAQSAETVAVVDVGSRVHKIVLNSAEVVATLRSASTLVPLSGLVDSGSRAAINASFFTKSVQAVGSTKEPSKKLYVSDRVRGVVGWRNTSKGVVWYFDKLSKDDEGNVVSDFYTYPWWDEAEYVIEGAPLLISDGRLVAYGDEKLARNFATKRRARSALCVNTSHQVVLFLVEGSNRWFDSLGYRGGMSILELRDYLFAQGCRYAINLDGGYSATMYADDVWYYGLNSFIPPLPPRAIYNALVFHDL